MLLHVAVVRPVFVWGAPGIGKSSLVRAFAESLGLHVRDPASAPSSRRRTSSACPSCATAAAGSRRRSRSPATSPYCLFLDELNSSAPEVQKAFYSLILDRRIGAYELPAGSIVIGAGNRATDNALARPMASALVNRLIHVHLRADAADWLDWAGPAGIHPWILDHLTLRPDHLWAQAAEDRGAVLHAPQPGTCSPTRCTPTATTSTRRRCGCWPPAR